MTTCDNRKGKDKKGRGRRRAEDKKINAEKPERPPRRSASGSKLKQNNSLRVLIEKQAHRGDGEHPQSQGGRSSAAMLPFKGPENKAAC